MRFFSTMQFHSTQTLAERSATLPEQPATRLMNRMGKGQRWERFFCQMLPAIGKQLQCDRVFIYVRSPYHQVGRVPFCWQRHADIPQVYDPSWKAEPDSLADDDPMFRAALNAEPSLFIEDVEAASPDVLNREFERKTFGHRALIHGHLCIERKLWGVLQPCVFDHPRSWTQSDRQLIERAVGWLAPVAMEYVNLNYTPEPSN